jgi:hypothetical protein
VIDHAANSATSKGHSSSIALEHLEELLLDRLPDCYPVLIAFNFFADFQIEIHCGLDKSFPVFVARPRGQGGYARIVLCKFLCAHPLIRRIEYPSQGTAWILVGIILSPTVQLP